MRAATATRVWHWQSVEWMAAVLAAERTAMPRAMSRRLQTMPGEFEFGGLIAQGLGVVEEFGAGGVPAGAAVVVRRVPAWQQADEQDGVDFLGGVGVPEPDSLRRLLALVGRLVAAVAGSISCLVWP